LRRKAARASPVGGAAPRRTRFDIDPIADGALIGISFGFAFVLDRIKSTGEIRPQQVPPDFGVGSLLAIDRAAVTATPDPSAGNWSNERQHR
jgi:hypothetical protein